MKRNLTGVIAIVVAVVLAAGLYLGITKLRGRGGDINYTAETGADYELRSIASDNGIVSDYLWYRTKSLMLPGDTPLIPSYVTIAGRLSYQGEEVSDECLISDQGLLLKAYVRLADRRSAQALKDEVLSSYTFENLNNGDLSSWLDAYLEYYSHYGTDSDKEEIVRLAAILFDEEGNMREETLSVAVYEQSGFVSTVEVQEDAESTLEQGTEAEGYTYTQVRGIELKSVNLRMIRSLEENNLLPEGSFEKNLSLVKGGFISSSIPLYAYAYVDESYVYAHDVAAAIDVQSSIVTMRHLSEVGEVDSDAYTWLKRQLINGAVLGDEFYIYTGATGGNEAVDIYPDIMHIAIECDDMDLYELSSTLEGSRVATYSSSPALYMIYREESERFTFYARENLDVLLAVV